MISRRGFLVTSAAWSAALPFAASCAEKAARRLRLGVIADLHVKSEGSTETFEKALRFFDAQKVDGVVCAGDLATSGITSELERVGKAWFKVFPDNRRSDGKHVEKLFIYGDHDMGGYAWRESRRILSEEELRAQIIPTHDPKAIWERCFKEPWSPVQVKTVNGFVFVLAHHPPHSAATAHGNYIAEVEPTLASLGARLEGKPFFYVQHRPIPGLAGEDTVWRKGDPRIGATLRKYPTCVALTGHTHRCCTDEQMLWQGEFTAINIPCLRYLNMPPGRENSDKKNRADGLTRMMAAMSPRDGQQGYLMDVTDGEIAIQRLDFSYSTGAAVAPTWRIGRRSGTDRPTDLREEVAPTFPPDAKVRVRARTTDKTRDGETKPSFIVAFPPALSTRATPRAFDYEITVEGAGQTVVKRVFSKKCYLPEALDAGNVECVMAREGFGEGPVTFTVRPCAYFGAKGAAIVGRWKA